MQLRYLLLRSPPLQWRHRHFDAATGCRRETGRRADHRCRVRRLRSSLYICPCLVVCSPRLGRRSPPQSAAGKQINAVGACSVGVSGVRALDRLTERIRRSLPLSDYPTASVCQLEAEGKCRCLVSQKRWLSMRSLGVASLAAYPPLARPKRGLQVRPSR